MHSWREAGVATLNAFWAVAKPARIRDEAAVAVMKCMLDCYERVDGVTRKKEQRVVVVVVLTPM